MTLILRSLVPSFGTYTGEVEGVVLFPPSIKIFPLESHGGFGPASVTDRGLLATGTDSRK